MGGCASKTAPDTVDDPSQTQTFPTCTVQQGQQWRYACREAALLPVAQRLCSEGTKRSLLSDAANDKAADLWAAVKARVDAGDDDAAVYGALRALVHPKGAAPKAPVPAEEEKQRLRRAEKRVTSALTLLSAAPDFGVSTCPTALLDLGCGRDVCFAALLAKELNCEAFAVDTMWEPAEVPRKEGLTYSRVDQGEPLPFADGTLDVVCAMMVLHHVPQSNATLREVARVLKPGGLFLMREHDCPRPELGVVLDIAHGLHNFVWPEEGRGQSPSVQDFARQHWARYRPKEEWREMAQRQGLAHVCTNGRFLEAADRSYFDLFQKPRPPLPARALAMPQEVDAERVAVVGVPYDAGAPVLRAALFRLLNAEHAISQRVLPKGKRLLGDGDARSVVPRPVLFALLGQVGAKAYQLHLETGKVPVGSRPELPAALASRLFDTPEAAEVAARHHLPGEWEAGAVRVEAVANDLGMDSCLASKLREALASAKAASAVLLFNKFADSPLHQLWARLLKEVRWDLPVVCVCREAEAAFFGKEKSGEERPKYTWAAPGNEAALRLRPERSGTSAVYAQQLPQDSLSELVTHAVFTTGERVGAELPLNYKLAKLLAGGEPGAPPEQPAPKSVVCLLLNGGMNMLKAASLAGEHKVPVVALNGTGRLANVTALAMMKDSPAFRLDDYAEWIAKELRAPSTALTPDAHRMLETFLRSTVLIAEADAPESHEFGDLLRSLLHGGQGSGAALQSAISQSSAAERLAAAAKLGVAWVRAGYLKSLKGLMPRCQDVPKEAFVRPDPTGKLEPLAISHPWYERFHPDNAQGFKLGLIQARLHKAGVGDDVPVFLDYLCMPQLGAGGEEDRSAGDLAVFEMGLNAVNEVFATARVLVVETVPAGMRNALPYHSRGWCFFEASVAILCGRLLLTDDFTDCKWASLQLKLRALGGMETGRAALDSFCAAWTTELASRVFTNNADHAKVAELFKSFVQRRLS